MQHKVIGDAIYLRVDKGEDILQAILDTCRQKGVLSAVFSGISACQDVIVQTYLADKDEFLDHHLTGMLEMVSLNGNISQDKGKIYQHSHACFSYLDPIGDKTLVVAGHLDKAVVAYTAEIKISPVKGGQINRKIDPITGIDIWVLD